MSAITYGETYRPQFHFTARRGWLNDPNGLVFHRGEFPLCFQHNPDGTEWGNMTWGHAVSPDLVHWRELEPAIRPYDGGTVFSGSAVVDSGNTSGLGEGAEEPLVALFTHAREPFGQALAYSNDRGRTWQLHDRGRRVLDNLGRDGGERDPRVFRHEPTGQWVMVLWAGKDTAGLFTSPDLTHWTHASWFTAPGFYECPDLFELPVEGEPAASRWILHDASFTYWVGGFDGRRFTPEAGPIRGEYGRNFYAAQTWNNLPGRRVQIAWMRGGAYPAMPFNQQMSFPCKLTLRRTPDGLRLCRVPVAELGRLGERMLFENRLTLRPGSNPLARLEGDCFDIRLEAEAGSASVVGLRVHGQDIRFEPRRGVLSAAGATAPLRPGGPAVELRLLVDRTSIEVFADRGAVSMSSCFLPPAATTGLALYAEGGEARIRAASVRPIRSI
jgi:sucrose-6-phosphate hydrolase SacC (GH32 family)